MTSISAQCHIVIAFIRLPYYLHVKHVPTWEISATISRLSTHNASDLASFLREGVALLCTRLLTPLIYAWNAALISFFCSGESSTSSTRTLWRTWRAARPLTNSRYSVVTMSGAVLFAVYELIASWALFDCNALQKCSSAGRLQVVHVHALKYIHLDLIFALILLSYDSHVACQIKVSILSWLS